jgi:hypothetical protein
MSGEASDDALLQPCTNCGLQKDVCMCVECEACLRMTRVISGVIEQTCQHCGFQFWDEGELNEYMLEIQKERH